MKIELTEKQAIVKYDDIEYLHSVPIEVLTDFLQVKTRTGSLLPRNCRYFSMLNNHYCVFVIEEDPQIRTIHVNHPHMVSTAFSKFKSLGVYDTGTYQPDQKNFTLSFPYIIYVITVVSTDDGQFELSDISIFFRTRPLHTLEDQLYHLPVLNRYESGRLCVPPITAKTANEVVSEVIETFWTSEFNDDITTSPSLRVPVVSNLFEWDYMTKKNPLFVLNLELELATPLKYVLPRPTSLDFFRFLDILTRSKLENTSSPLLHDKTDVMCIDKHSIYRGDVIEFKNKELEILHFVSRNGTEKTYIYGRIGDKKCFFKLTSTFRNAIAKILEEKQVRSVTSRDGRVFSIGDIYTVQGQYFQISKIRPSIGTNDYELFCGNKIFMLSDFSQVAEKLDLSQYIGDVLIKQPPATFVTQYYTKQFISEVICRNNYLYLKSSSGKQFDIHDVVQLEGLQQIGSGPYRIGSTVSMLSNALRDSNGFILIEDKRDNVKLDCTDKFSIKGFDIDLTFEKGDTVIYANNDPKSRLDIHEITSIRGLDRLVIITIRSMSTGEEKQLAYIHQSTVTLLGQLRKVALEYKGVRAGQRVVAKRSRVPCFPKHEVNEIIAFVVDHVSEPLVLCSNGCTIWWSALFTAFDVLDKNSRAYRKQLASIRPLSLQPGDLVSHNDLTFTGWYCFRCVKGLNFPFHDFWGFQHGSRPGLFQIIGVPEPRVPVKYATDPTFHTEGFSLGHGTFYSVRGFTVLDHNKLKKEVFGV